uniref:Thrombomodulin n=2 Tax=Cyprinus carpio TaxID=7962 RepID=A0A8C1IK67_CYPCA
MKDITVMLALVVLRVCGKHINDGYCVDGKCFVVHVHSASFDAAQLVCQEKGGHLMTVRTEKVADVLGRLLTSASGDFWLGLKYPCSDSNNGLKGYRWVTGDSTTNYVNWKSNLTVCSRCVSVSRKVLKWTERACNNRIEGFLCEYNNTDYCPPLSNDAPVSYQTHFGFTAKEELKEIPQYSNATLQPLRTRHVCFEGAWHQAPWSCEVGGGGCEYKCIQEEQKSTCICPPGFKLDINNVTCSKDDDPCAHVGCQHNCTRHGDAFACTCRPGFHLGADGKSCEDCNPGFYMESGVCVDDNECMFAPCEHYCINTNGSYHCTCRQGYIQSEEDSNKCKMHCTESKCKAHCDTNNHAQCNCPDGFLFIDMDKSCVDMNECEIGFCDQKCENTPGGFQCSCDKGFVLIDKFHCIKNFKGSGNSTPFDNSIPTSRSPTDKTASISAASLLGIMVCIVLCILLLVCLAQCIMRRLSKMHHYDMDNGHHEILFFQQVIIENPSTQKTFPSRYLKTDT